MWQPTAFQSLSHRFTWCVSVGCEEESGMLAGGAKRKRETDHPVITALHTHPGDPVMATGSGYYLVHIHTKKAYPNCECVFIILPKQT